ncbi:MAG: SufD family Fe-S cluster assembly protein [Candidatus Aminicenantaceae bacterium]
MQDYKLMLDAYKKSGGAPEAFKDSKIAHLVVHKNKVLGKHLVEGLIIVPEETESGINVILTVRKGFRISTPVHLCFGIIPEEGRQEINIQAKVEDNVRISLLAHCVFPNAVKIQHIMKANIEIGDNAFYEYNEVHFHGEKGGIEVIPQAKIKVGKKSQLKTNFSLLKGRVGVFDLDYQAEVDDEAVLEMITKIYGYGEDRIKIKEGGRLTGKASRGLIKSRIAVRDEAQSEVVNEMIAEGENSRGHVDCVEIVQDQALAKAIPIVEVIHPLAQVTHEAAIGRVDKKQVETVMARGLEEEKAIDIVVGGMLK